MLTSAKLEANAGTEQVAVANYTQYLPLVQSRGTGPTVFNILIWRDIIKDPGLLNGSRIHKLIMLVKARPGIVKALGFLLFVCLFFCSLVAHKLWRCDTVKTGVNNSN